MTQGLACLPNNRSTGVHQQHLGLHCFNFNASRIIPSLCPLCRRDSPGSTPHNNSNNNRCSCQSVDVLTAGMLNVTLADPNLASEYWQCRLASVEHSQSLSVCTELLTQTAILRNYSEPFQQNKRDRLNCSRLTCSGRLHSGLASSQHSQLCRLDCSTACINNHQARLSAYSA